MAAGSLAGHRTHSSWSANSPPPTQVYPVPEEPSGSADACFGEGVLPHLLSAAVGTEPEMCYRKKSSSWGKTRSSLTSAAPPRPCRCFALRALRRGQWTDGASPLVMSHAPLRVVWVHDVAHVVQAAPVQDIDFRTLFRLALAKGGEGGIEVANLKRSLTRRAACDLVSSLTYLSPRPKSTSTYQSSTTSPYNSYDASLHLAFSSGTRSS